MELVKGSELVNLCKNVVYAGKQTKPHSIDLTVKKVYQIESKGSLDFGGSEYKASEAAKIKPVKKNPEDEYGWWDLKHGSYLITLNETIEEIEGVGFISPHPRLLKAGAFHPTLITLEWKSDYVLVLNVPANGLSLKENSRVSKLLVLKH